MSYFIIIRGPAAVGKTKIAKQLAERIGAGVVHYDLEMDKLGLDFVEGDKWIPLRNFQKTDNLLIPKFIEKLQKGKILILEGNFYHKQQIEYLIEKLEFKNFVFTLKADLQECLKRDKTRKPVLGDDAVKAVYKLVAAFDYGKVIDTNAKTEKEIVDELISSISKH